MRLAESNKKFIQPALVDFATINSHKYEPAPPSWPETHLPRPASGKEEVRRSRQGFMRAGACDF